MQELLSITRRMELQLQSNITGHFINNKKLAAAVIAFAAIAAVIFILGNTLFGGTHLVLRNASTGAKYASFPIEDGDTFSIGFIHSVNKSPLTDYYEVRGKDIYVVKTVYYGFGAGVQTEIEEGQTLTYGDDGSMIVTGFNKKIDPLTYFVGTVSDHILCINEGEDISLRDLCGRNARVGFYIE